MNLAATIGEGRSLRPQGKPSGGPKERKAEPPPHERRGFLLAVPILLFGTLLCREAAGDYRQATIKDFADIHSGPGEDYYIVEDGEQGDSFLVLDEQGEWVKLRLTTGTGWVLRSKVDISIVEGEELEGGEDAASGDTGDESGRQGGPVEAQVSRKRAKLYAEPDTGSVVVKKLSKRTPLEVVGRSKDGRWYKVRHDGPKAWVRAKDVRLIGLESTEVAEATVLHDREYFRIMSDREIRKASLALGAGGLTLWVGMGEARVRQRFEARPTTRTYKYENYRPPPKYEIATPGPAFVLGGRYWFHVNLGLELSGRVVWANKGIEVRDPAYTRREEKLTLASYSFDLAGQLRYPFLREGAFFMGRLGYKYFQLGVDQARPPPEEIGGATSPLFWSMIYQGPLLGAGMRFPLASWVGVQIFGDLLPYAFARNSVTGGDAQTPSGDVDHAWGLTGRVALWFLVHRGAFDIDLEARGFYEYFAYSLSVDPDKNVPRARPPYLSYESASGSELAVGGALSLSLCF